MSDIAKLLRATTEQMACTASVDMTLWDKHSNACLEASDKIEELRKDASAAWAMCASISAKNERLRAALSELVGAASRVNMRTGTEFYTAWRAAYDITKAATIEQSSIVQSPEAADEIERLRAENEKLRSALKPFVTAPPSDANPDDYDWLMVRPEDIRAAAAALKETGGE